MEKKYIELALKNIQKFGDTDIFPFPIENHIFYDTNDDIIEHIQNIDKYFSVKTPNNSNVESKIYVDYIDTNSPVNINTFSQVGYTGFRWVTQIDPEWNLYLLSLVLSISKEIENDRISVSKNIVHSYRFKPNYNTGELFEKNINWKSFQLESLEIVKKENFQYIISCDIADFYSRIYHHRLENSLLRLNLKNNSSKKIIKILQKFSGTNSYGLPIGGPAARILAELLLNNIDKILQINGIRFTRFVDDIYIFAKTKEEAHSHLTLLSHKLMTNEGLTLQKHKTQILSKAEFQNLINLRVKGESDDLMSNQKAKFLALPLRYDPYSPTADEDYKRIKNELSNFDILDLLNEELKKSRIHQQFSKHLLKTFNVLDEEIVSNAMISISDRIEMLYPIFPNLMIALFSNFSKLDYKSKEITLTKLRELVINNSYIVQIELNIVYLIRVLGLEQSPENEEILSIIYRNNPSSIFIKSWIIQIFTKWKLNFWLSDLKQNFPTMTKWERRIFIIASYFLNDEGKHWREHNKNQFSKFEIIIRDWASKKISSKTWEIPL